MLHHTASAVAAAGAIATSPVAAETVLDDAMLWIHPVHAFPLKLGQLRLWFRVSEVLLASQLVRCHPRHYVFIFLCLPGLLSSTPTVLQ